MSSYKNIDKDQVENILSLTPLQEGILFHYLKDINKNLYFVQLSLDLEGSVNITNFKRAWQSVINNNEMLRTVFRWEKLNKPVQVILKETNIDIRYYDLSEKGSSFIETEIQNIKLEDYKEGFDLRDVSFRITLCKITNKNYILLISNHHILYDGWSNGIILKEFLSYYNGRVNSNSIKNKEKTSFKNYIKLNQEVDLKGKEFWKGYLSDYEVNTILQSKYHNTLLENVNESYKYVITEDKVNLLKKSCESHRLTIADILYNAWGILLSKYSGEGDILFGTTVSGRNIKLDGIENMVGLFINTIPIRIRISPNKQLISVIKENAKQILERRKFENVPLQNILEYSGYKENELIESIFVIENYPLDKENLQQHDKLAFKSFSIKESTNYPLTVSAFISNEIEISFSYLNKYFGKGQIESIGKHYARIIDWVINDNKSDIISLDLLSEEDKQQLLYEFNDTKKYYPKDKSIHQLFEEQAERTPDNIAVCCNGEKIKYKELSIRSNQLANYLKDCGFANTLIGIMIERSIEMIVGIFGILKSGNAYLPLDPQQPQDRNFRILKESQVKAVLSDHNETKFRDIKYFNLKNENIYKECRTCEPRKFESSDLAYVIYTSGSTGIPKGVMVSHGNIVNFVFGMTNVVSEDTQGSVLSLTTISFDIFGLELYAPLFRGLSMILVEDNTSLNEITSIVQIHKVSILQLTPSRLTLLLSDDKSRKIFKKIKVLLVGGEEFPAILLSELREIYKGAIYNMYGPTETTIWSTYKDVSGDLPLNIGQPIINTQIYILDKDDKLQPIGISGELCIGGKGLATGYLNKPELTSEKFIDHPFKKGEKIYRTGDLARWLPDGNIEFIGRIDHQVKIRGFRVELGEIENALLQHQSIQKCAVLAREFQDDKYLCAYIVSAKEQNNEDLRTYLSGLIPDYMIPSYFVNLKEMPLTNNGKINRKVLPLPEIKAGTSYEAPKTPIEAKLLKIWSEVLNVSSKEISTNISFFELGGHSLKATILVSRIDKELDVQLELQEIFQANTIQKMAKIIEVKDLVNQDLSEIETNKDLEQIVI